MNDQITLVTSPDDVYHDAMRIVLVDLNTDQSYVVSQTLTSFESLPPLVVYVWSHKDSPKWLVDKKFKSQLLVFNADSECQDIVGYIAAQPNAHYFGNLKSLHHVNNKAIYGAEDFKELFTKQIEGYEIR
jgi:hypothetical protein